MEDDPFALDLSWLPLSGWASKGNTPRRQADGTLSYKAASSPSEAFTSSDYGPIQAAGMVAAVGGAFMTAIGSYAELEHAKYEAKFASANLEFEAQISGENARAAELEAQSLLEVGQQQIGQLTMAAGAQKSARTAEMAGRGIRLGVGSAARVQASGDLIREMDVLSISVNATRAANAARTQRVNYENQSLLNRASARNARRTARSIRPGLGAIASFGSSAAEFGSQYATDRRYGVR